jgi:hypothetical protein
MLTVLGTPRRLCDGLTRREALQAAAEVSQGPIWAATCARSQVGLLRRGLRPANVQKLNRRCLSCVMLLRIRGAVAIRDGTRCLA